MLWGLCVAQLYMDLRSVPEQQHACESGRTPGGHPWWPVLALPHQWRNARWQEHGGERRVCEAG